jgi:acyl-homoserine lactone acylase PvdQ
MPFRFLSLSLALSLVACGKDAPKDVADDSRLDDSRPDDSRSDDTSDTEPVPEDDTIELIRDTQGVPHISAQTRRGMFYGLGVASAQDRMFQMDFFRRKAAGRLAEFAWLEGEDEFNQGLVDNDIEHRIAGFWNHAQTVVANLPEQAALDLKSFADGVNQHLESLDDLPALYKIRGIEEIAPWTEADSLLVWDHIWVFQGRPGNEIKNELKAWIDCLDPTSTDCVPSCVRPVDDGAAIVPEEVAGNFDRFLNPDGAHLPRARSGATDPPETFSHGWVVSGTRSTTGKPVIAFDPKIPLWAPSIFYPFHITSPEINMRGMGFAGAPAGFAYWNEHLGQTITAAHGDTVDLFVLQRGSDDGHYVLDGVEVAFEIREEEIVRGDGTTLTVTVQETSWGPVINGLPSLQDGGELEALLTQDPTAQEPPLLFAAKILEQTRNDTHSLIAHMGAMFATNLNDYRTALGQGVTPYLHALYAGVDAGDPDGSGHIAYHPSAGIPHRVPLVIGGMDYTGQHPYDGSDSNNDWSGMLTIDERPHVIDPSSGHLYAANNLTVGSWYLDQVYTGFGFKPGNTFRGGILQYELGQMFPDASAQATPRQVHDLHGITTSHIADGMREIYTYIIDTLGTYGTAPAPGASTSTAHDKAHKVREALDAYHAQGTGFVESNPFEDLVKWVTQRLKRQAGTSQNPQIECTWNTSETAANWIVREARENPAAFLALHPDFAEDFFLDVAVDIYDSMSANNSEGAGWQSDDMSTWVADAPQDLDIPFGFVLTHCLQPEDAADDTCSLDASHVIHEDALEHRNKNLIVSSSDSSMPATVDFANVDAATWLFPIGVSEDPSSPSFDSFLEDWRIYANDASDDSAYSNAPLTESLVNVESRSTLRYGTD